MGIENIFLFCTGAVVVITAPGIDTIYIINRSISQGQRTGIYSAIGICCGIFVHTLMAALGLSAVISASAVFYSFIKFAGATYLICLGIEVLIKKTTIDIETSKESIESLHEWEVFKKGMMTNVLNPKPALFFLSFLPQFVKPEYADSLFPFFLLGGVFFIMAISWCMFLAISAARISAFVRNNDRFQHVLQRLSGLVFIGLGIKIAFEENDPTNPNWV